MAQISHGFQTFTTGTTTTETGTWQNVDTVSSTNFTAGGTYLYLVMVEIEAPRTSSVAAGGKFRVMRGATELTPWSGYDYLDGRSQLADAEFWHVLFPYVDTQPGTAEDLDIEFLAYTGDTADVNRAQVIWIRLDSDLTEGTDWKSAFSDDSASPVSLTTSYADTGADASFTAGTGESWLVLGFCQFKSISTNWGSAQHFSALQLDTDTEVDDMQCEGESFSTSNVSCWHDHMWLFTPSSGSRSVSMRAKHASTSTAEVVGSGLVAIRLDAFETFSHTSKASHVTGTSGTWANIDTFEHNPDTTADHLFVARAQDDQGAFGTTLPLRIQVEDSDIYTSWGDDGGHSAADSADVLNNVEMGMKELTGSFGAYTVDLDVDEGGSAWNYDRIDLLAVSMELLTTSQTVTLPHISAGTVTPPTVSAPSQIVTLPHISAGSVTPPTVSAPSQTVTLPHVSAGTVHTPTVTPGAVTVTLPHITAGTVTPPTVAGGAVTVTIPHISAGTVYAPTVSAPSQSVTLPHVSAGTTVYAPAVGLNVALPLVDASATVYAPTVSAASQTVTLPHVSGTTVHAPTLAPGAVTVTLPHVSGTTVHAPTVSAPSQTVTLPHVSGTTVYAQTVSAPSQTISLPFLGGDAYATVLDDEGFHESTSWPLGDFDVGIKLAADWASWSSTQYVFGNVELSAATVGAYGYVNSAGKFIVTVRSTASGNITLGDNIAWEVDQGDLADGEVVWLRATFDASAGDFKVYTSPDGLAWTLRGTDLSETAVTDPEDTGGDFYVGRIGLFDSTDFAGDVYAFKVKATYDDWSAADTFSLDVDDWNGVAATFPSGGVTWSVDGSPSKTTASGGSTVYTPSVSATPEQTLTLPHITAGTVHTPTVGLNVTLPHISAGTVHAPTVSAPSQTVTTPHITAGTVHAPTVTPGAVTVTLPHVSGTTVHAPTVALDTLQTVTLPHVSGTTVHAPTVTPGAVTVTLPHISAGTVTPPTLAATYTVTIPHISGTTVLPPTVAPGAVTVTIPHVTGTTVYALTITGGAQPDWIRIDLEGDTGATVHDHQGTAVSLVDHEASSHTTTITGVPT